MRVALFCHSLISDWNHGNAHFLRGVCRELLRRGHQLRIFEPRDSWSLQNLLSEHGSAPVQRFHAAYPQLESMQYELASLDLDAALDGCELVLLHEWNDPELVRRVGAHRAENQRYRLLFHDTHHRSVTAPAEMRAYDLRHFDGVLAFGEVIRDIYLRNGWAERSWTWHEAADTGMFRPIHNLEHEGDLVWIGNWGDEERTLELEEFLLEPVRQLKLRTRVYGVRYPGHAREALAGSGIEYSGWLPNFEVPRTFGSFSITVHIPRRPYVTTLPGIPTIRVFEALACGIPLICSPWHDSEGLFEPGKDYLTARTGLEMARLMKALLSDPDMARELARNGRRKILDRHTCAHRVDELLTIYSELMPRDQKENASICRMD